MANVGSKGIVRYEETFMTENTATTAADGVAWLSTTDAGTDITRAATAGKGLHAYGVTDTGSADRAEWVSGLPIFTGQEGHSAVEIMLQLSAVTTVAFNFGFNDAVTGANNIIPASITTTTITGQSADGWIGLIYDTNADNDELHCHWRNGAVDTTTSIADLRMTGMAPTLAKWLYMKVEMQDAGSGNPVIATFLAIDHNGRSVEKRFTTSVDRDLPMYYYLGIENRTTTARTFYIKCPAWEQSIANM